MRHLISALMLLILLKVSGCREEKFVPDPDDPRLQKYTESGNDVGGALISNVAWKTNLVISYDVSPGSPPPFYIHNYPNADSLIVRINGAINEGINKGAPIYFAVGIRGTGVKAYQGLKNLKNKIFVIDGKTNYLTVEDLMMMYDGTTEIFKNGTGRFNIVNVQQRTKDTILSGTFDFRFETASGIIDVQKGRFDFVVSGKQYYSN